MARLLEILGSDGFFSLFRLSGAATRLAIFSRFGAEYALLLVCSQAISCQHMQPCSLKSLWLGGAAQGILIEVSP